MTTSQENAERLQSIAVEMADLLSEFKGICKESMTRGEYEQFKYRTLGHLEPGLIEDSEWYTKYSSIDSLEKVAALAAEEAEPDEDDSDPESESEEDSRDRNEHQRQLNENLQSRNPTGA